MSISISAGGRRYGALKSKPDHRDYGISNIRGLDSPSLSVPQVDWEGYCGPVKDQGDLGACTAFAGCGMREFLWRKYTRYEKTLGLASPPILSPLFLYYQERQLDGTLGEGDTGSDGRTSVRTLNQFGVCQETLDSYDISKFETPPTTEQLTEALDFKGGPYHRVYSVADMRSCLASGYAFVLCFQVYESFESEAVATSGVMPAYAACPVSRQSGRRQSPSSRSISSWNSI